MLDMYKKILVYEQRCASMLRYLKLMQLAYLKHSYICAYLVTTQYIFYLTMHGFSGKITGSSDPEYFFSLTCSSQTLL
jgi:hypothetical protein